MVEDIADRIEKPGMPLDVRIRLSLMMFLQFMMFAVFWVALATYLKNIKVTGLWRALAMSSMAIGCAASPIIGMIADRHFASQKVLAVLNLLSTVLLVVVAQIKDPTLVVVILIIQQLCYMPTWGLTSSIAMSHSPAEKFPQIRVFGSIGWVASGLFSIVAGWLFLDAIGNPLQIDGTNIPFLCGAGTGLVAALVALTLPNTPPPAKGQKASIVDALGLRSFSLMKNPNFAIFIIISTLVMIPFTIYWSYCSVFLQDQGFTYITVTMNWGQFVEMFAMLLVPLALAKFGVKRTMVFGLLALVIRYLLFLGGDKFGESWHWMYFGAILVHGVIFGFFFVGGQVYVDKRAPKELRAQAQGLLFLITFGVGLLAGNFFNEWLIGANSQTTTPVAKVAPAGAVKTNTTLMTDANTSVPVAITDVRLYDRALNGTEVELLTADEKVRVDILAAAEKNGVSADLTKGQVYSGDLADVAGKPVGKAFSFSANVTFPVDDPNSPVDNVLSGTLFQTGSGADAVRLSVKKNVLILQAGETTITARTVGLPRKLDAKTRKVQPMHVTVTSGEKGLTLYTNAAAYRTYEWGPIWIVTVAFSVALMVLFVVAFHYKEDKAAKAGA
jgi:nucleoside transporter